MNIEEIKAFFGLKFYPVPVKFHTENREGACPPKVRAFCDLVRLAAQGGSYVITGADAAGFECLNPEVVLGFRKPRYVEIEGRITKAIKSVMLGAATANDFDVLLFIANPRQAMDIAIALGGVEASFKGEMAVCCEATALVYNRQRANVSFLCHGCRDFSGYADDEVVLGITREETDWLLQVMEVRSGRSA